ncbi:MAG: ABC transporter ATP-binding protein [Planctomycetia bacterium]
MNSAAAPLLSVRGLCTYFRTEGGLVKAVDDVSFDVFGGEVLGIVGESGSGKSVASMSILGLVPQPPGLIAGGEILFDGRDLLKLSAAELRNVRGRDVAMIFQEPMSSLNPVFPIGMQLTEAVTAHEKVSGREARRRAAEMLTKVGIPDATRRLSEYPYQFSGGMRQRVMIAMALLCNPRLVVADEPTTALDVTIQAQILDLMLELMAQRPGASIMLITHDLAVVAETCKRVVVMYGGRVQESATTAQLFADPKHPYAQGLLRSLPARGERRRRLVAIPGNVPSIQNMPAGCKFANRCDQVLEKCWTVEPPLYHLGGGRLARCHLVESEALGKTIGPSTVQGTAP